MTKAKISEYDAVASNNTDVNGVNIAENCPPSGMNNMGREIMAALKRFQVGSDGDGVTVGGNLVVSGTSTVNTFTAGPVSATTLNTSGAVVFNDAGADVDFRVEGDSDANLLFVDASADGVGVGTGAPSYKLDVAQANPTRGIVARIQNSAGSSLTGTQLNFLQNTIDNWAIGMPAGESAFALWAGRTSGADGTEIARFTNTGDAFFPKRRRGYIYAAGVSAGTTGTYNIDATGFPGAGSGGIGETSRAYLYIVHSNGASHFVTGVGLYSNNFNGNALLLGTVGSAVVAGGTITFGGNGASPRATITNSSGSTPTYYAEIVCLN